MIVTSTLQNHLCWFAYSTGFVLSRFIFHFSNSISASILCVHMQWPLAIRPWCLIYEEVHDSFLMKVAFFSVLLNLNSVSKITHVRFSRIPRICSFMLHLKKKFRSIKLKQYSILCIRNALQKEILFSTNEILSKYLMIIWDRIQILYFMVVWQYLNSMKCNLYQFWYFYCSQ